MTLELAGSLGVWGLGLDLDPGSVARVRFEIAAWSGLNGDGNDRGHSI
jgi:hypothetical protein